MTFKKYWNYRSINWHLVPHVLIPTFLASWTFFQRLIYKGHHASSRRSHIVLSIRYKISSTSRRRGTYFKSILKYIKREKYQVPWGGEGWGLRFNSRQTDGRQNHWRTRPVAPQCKGLKTRNWHKQLSPFKVKKKWGLFILICQGWSLKSTCGFRWHHCHGRVGTERVTTNLKWISFVKRHLSEITRLCSYLRGVWRGGWGRTDVP